MHQCEYFYPDGQRCGNHVIPGSNFCLQHRRPAAAAGGPESILLIRRLAGFRQAAGMAARPAPADARPCHPGLDRDRQGVLVAGEGLVFLPVRDGDQGGRGLLPALLVRLSTIMDLGEILALHSLAGGRGFLLRLRPPDSEAADALSRFYDRLAAAVQLDGGRLFVGGGQHFIVYRDPGAPTGYDALGAPAPPDTLVLVDSTGSYHLPVGDLQSLEVTDLLLAFRPDCRRPPAAKTDGEFYALVPLAIYRLAARFCRRWQVDCQAARCGEEEREQVLLQLRHPRQVPVNVVNYLDDLPGCRVLAPAGRRGDRLLLVPRRCRFSGRADNLLGAFPDNCLAVLGDDRENRGLLFSPAPVFFPLESLTACQPDGIPATGIKLSPARKQLPRLSMSLQLVADGGRPPAAAGLLLRDREIEWFRRLRYRLPPFVFSRGEVFAGRRHLLLLGADLPAGLLPFGSRLYRYEQTSLLLPVGMKLLPAVAWPVLQKVLEVGADEYVVLTPRERLAFQRHDFVPLASLLQLDDQPPMEVKVTAWRLPDSGTPLLPPEMAALAAEEEREPPLTAAGGRESPTAGRSEPEAGMPPAGNPAVGSPADEAALFAARARRLRQEEKFLEAAVCFSLAEQPQAAADCYRLAARQLAAEKSP